MGTAKTVRWDVQNLLFSSLTELALVPSTVTALTNAAWQTQTKYLVNAGIASGTPTARSRSVTLPVTAPPGSYKIMARVYYSDPLGGNQREIYGLGPVITIPIPSVSVTAPASGAQWQVGTPQTISWTITNVPTQSTTNLSLKNTVTNATIAIASGIVNAANTGSLAKTTTYTPPSSLAAGVYLVGAEVVQTVGGLTRRTEGSSNAFTVYATSDFSLSVELPSKSVEQGASGFTWVAWRRTSDSPDFSPSVDFSLAPLPAGITASFQNWRCLNPNWCFADLAFSVHGYNSVPGANRITVIARSQRDTRSSAVVEKSIDFIANVVGRPDLYVSNIVATKVSRSAGNSIYNFTATIRNQGDGFAGRSLPGLSGQWVRVRLIAKYGSDNAETLDIHVPGLPPGGSASVNLTNVPHNVSVGTTRRALADVDDGNIREIDEGNNSREITYTVQ
jgi:hypothetical protein